MTYWKDRAACRDIEDASIFFPLDVNNRHRWDVARQFCAVCPVTEECLWMQLKACEPIDDRWGMFGGLTPAERRKYRDNAEVKQILGLPRRVRINRDTTTGATEG